MATAIKMHDRYYHLDTWVSYTVTAESAYLVRFADGDTVRLAGAAAAAFLALLTETTTVDATPPSSQNGPLAEGEPRPSKPVGAL